MKNKITKLLFLALIGSAFTACQDDDVMAVSSAVANKPTVTVTSSAATISEKDDDTTELDFENQVTFTLTTDRVLSVPSGFVVEVVTDGSTASSDDYVIDGGTETNMSNGLIGVYVEIPANESSVSFTLTAQKDILVEGSETVQLKFTPNYYINANIDAASSTQTVTISNGVWDELYLKLDWGVDQTYTDATTGESSTLADFDFDLEVYDEGFNGLADYSWSSAPEEVTIENGEIPDGLYYIVGAYYSNNDIVPASPIDFNVTLTAAKPGAFVHEFDLSGLWSTTVGSSTEGNSDAYQIVAYFIQTTVDGVATFQLYGMDDTLIAEGRMSQLRNFVLSHRSQRRNLGL